MYLSNEQPVQTNVYFDDFRIVRHTGIEQSNDYYAFGKVISPLSFDKGSVKNNFLYNSKELQDGLDGVYDYGARMYMSDIGRWGVIDPLSELMRRHSPYNYAYNNPIRFIDPDGMRPRSPSSINPNGSGGWDEQEEDDYGARTEAKLDALENGTYNKRKVFTFSENKAKKPEAVAAASAEGNEGGGGDDSGFDQQQKGATEITAQMITDIIEGLPKDGTSGQFLGVAVNLLKKYDNAYIKGTTITDLVQEPSEEVTKILGQINSINKKGNNISLSLRNPISYDLQLGSVTIRTVNNLAIENLSNTLISFIVTGVQTSFGALDRIEISTESLRVRINPGKLAPNLWKTVKNF